MRPSPRDPHAAFLLSAMNEVVLKSESASTANLSVLENVRGFLAATDVGSGDVTAYENADHQVAALFVAWSKALAAHDHVKAAGIEQQLATFTKNNPFPYSETA